MRKHFTILRWSEKSLYEKNRNELLTNFLNRLLTINHHWPENTVLF